MTKKMLPIRLGLAVALGVSSAAADPEFTGSGVMLDFVQGFLGYCLGSTPRSVYTGGGSAVGELHLVDTYFHPQSQPPATDQIIAPMSRELRTLACGAMQDTAKGWLVALDAVSVVSSTAAAEICDPAPGDEDPATPGTQAFGANLRRSGSIALQDLGRNGDGRPVNIAGNPATGTQVPAGGAFLYPRPPDGIVCKGCGPVTAGLPSDTTDTTYTFQDITLAGTVIPGTAWEDVLRILYTGATHSMGNTRIGFNAGSNLATTTAISSFCGGDLRRSLVAQWQNIIEGCSSDGACAGGVKRLFRGGDTAASTDTFLGILDLPSVLNNPGSTQSGALRYGWPLSGIPFPGSPFCNGNDQRDNDPIRIPCSTTTNQGQAVDMVCNRYVVDNNGTAGNSKDDEVINSVGLLVPVYVPEPFAPPAAVPSPGLPPTLPLALPDISSIHTAAASGTPKYEDYRKSPRPLCTTSTAIGRAPTDPDTGLQVSICADGTPALGGTCQVLATSGSNGAYPSCLSVNRATTAPNVATHFGGNTCGPGGNLSCVPFRPEGRAYNTTVYNPPPSLPAPASYGSGGVRVAQYSRKMVGVTAQPLRDVNMALYRMRQTVRPVAPAPIAADVCAFGSSNENLRCLVETTGCALGIASLGTGGPGSAVEMKVDAVQPTVAQVRARAYPLSRGLYLNTLANVSGGGPGQFNPPPATPFQEELAFFMECVDFNPNDVNLYADQLGLISVPLGPQGLQCVDFRDDQLDPRLPAGASGNTCSSPHGVNPC